MTETMSQRRGEGTYEKLSYWTLARERNKKRDDRTIFGKKNDTQTSAGWGFVGGNSCKLPRARVVDRTTWCVVTNTPRFGRRILALVVRTNDLSHFARIRRNVCSNTNPKRIPHWISTVSSLDSRLIPVCSKFDSNMMPV